MAQVMFFFERDEMSEMIDKNRSKIYIAAGMSDESEFIPVISAEDEDVFLISDLQGNRLFSMDKPGEQLNAKTT